MQLAFSKYSLELYKVHEKYQILNTLWNCHVRKVTSQQALRSALADKRIIDLEA